MTKTLAVDENNDIYLGGDGALAIASGIEAVLQAAQQAAQTMTGEMQYAVDQGMPNFAVIWNGAPNLSQFDAALRRTLLAVPHVQTIQSLSLTVADNAVSYVATIVTNFGTGAING